VPESMKPGNAAARNTNNNAHNAKVNTQHGTMNARNDKKNNNV